MGFLIDREIRQTRERCSSKLDRIYMMKRMKRALQLSAQHPVYPVKKRRPPFARSGERSSASKCRPGDF